MLLHAKSFQLCPILCDPMNCSLPVSSVLGISQARILEWAVISFSIIYIYKIYKMVLVAQSYLTLYDPMDCSPPDSSVHGISQARILEWVAVFSSRGSS